MFIPISRRSSSPGGPSCQVNHLGDLAPALLEVQLLLAILIPPQHFFPEGINGALTEVGCEEALRKKSHCASEELMFFFQE